MKKIFFFFLFLISITTIKADTIKHLEILNGKLSIPFDSKVNDYTVYLIEGSTNIKANYTLKDKENTVKIEEDQTKAIYTVYKNDKELEHYTFYKIIPQEQAVFEPIINEEPKEIKNLFYYIFIPCFIIIIILFKIIVLRKKHKINYGKINCPSWFKKRKN